MSVLNGDYIGFTYNGIHSSELGLIRTSDGSRYNEPLLPVSQDKTVQVPGGDGTYFFESHNTSRIFTLSVAFDSMTETQLRKIKAILGDKKVHPLILDELPFKTYMVKVTGVATLKFLTFSERKNDGSVERVYKGEGELQFTAFNPYAKVTHKFLQDYVSCDNISFWKEASGLLQEPGNFDKKIGNKIYVYNPGDLETDWILKVNFKNGKIPATQLSLGKEILGLSEMSQQGQDDFIRISSKTNLIEGFKIIEGVEYKTGTLYNANIIYGDFFKIPLGGKKEDLIFTFDNANGFINNLEATPLSYDYFYY